MSKGAFHLNKNVQEVYYTQSVYRKLLDCMARPGKLEKLKAMPSNFETLSSYTFGIALTLLDQEVSFHILQDEENTSRVVQLYTMAKKKSIEKCDYLFLHEGQYVDLYQLKKGTPEFPDESATIISEVARISHDELHSESTIKLTLTGPGIKGKQEISISGIHHDLLPAWKQINQEFPLGIDWIIVDQEGMVCCIPRSSRMEWEVL